MKEKSTNKANPKPQPVNKEAFKMLAMEIGLNAASRKLGVPIPTGKSWPRRGGWKLPKRSKGRPYRTLPTSSESSLHPIADALASSHKELDSRTRTALAQATAAAAEKAATEATRAENPQPLPVSSITVGVRGLCSILPNIWNPRAASNASRTFPHGADWGCSNARLETVK